MRGALIAAACVGMVTVSGVAVAEQAAPAAPAGGQGQQAAPTPDQIIEELIKSAYKGAKFESVPLTPGQTQDYLRSQDEVDKAAAKALPPQKTFSETKPVSVEPGAQPTKLLSGYGFTTIVAVFDATGQPWPIETATVGNPKVFELGEKKSEGAHYVTLTPKERYRQTNLVLKLQDLPVLITFDLEEGTGQVHTTFNARINQLGPKHKLPLIESLKNMSAADGTLMSFLQGVPPAGAERLSIAGLDGRTAAWEFEGAVYLRSPHSLLAPHWDGQVSLDEMTTYRINGAPPVLVLSDGGTMVRARLERRAPPPTARVTRGKQ